MLEIASSRATEFKDDLPLANYSKNVSRNSKSGLRVLNEKEIVERLSHPNILNCLEIIGRVEPAKRASGR